MPGKQFRFFADARSSRITLKSCSRTNLLHRFRISPAWTDERQNSCRNWWYRIFAYTFAGNCRQNQDPCLPLNCLHWKGGLARKQSSITESESTYQQSYSCRTDYSPRNYLRRYRNIATLCFECHNKRKAAYWRTRSGCFILCYLDPHASNYHQVCDTYFKGG